MRQHEAFYQSGAIIHQYIITIVFNMRILIE